MLTVSLSSVMHAIRQPKVTTLMTMSSISVTTDLVRVRVRVRVRVGVRVGVRVRIKVPSCAASVTP